MATRTIVHFARECVHAPRIWNGAPVLPVRPLRSASFNEESIEGRAEVACEASFNVDDGDQTRLQILMVYGVR